MLLHSMMEIFRQFLVKSREGRPIWLKGKKDGFTSGGITPQFLLVLNLYNSSRLNGPKKTMKNQLDIY